MYMYIYIYTYIFQNKIRTIPVLEILRNFHLGIEDCS